MRRKHITYPRIFPFAKDFIPVRCLLLALAILIFSPNLFSQSPDRHKTDSLHRLLNQASEDANKVDVLNELADAFLDINYDISFKYSMRAVDLGGELDYTDGLLRAIHKAASIHVNYSLNYYEGYRLLLRALTIAQNSKKKKAEVGILRQIAHVHYAQGDFDKSIELTQEALSIARRLESTSDISALNSYLGNLYEDHNDNETALYFYHNVLKNRTG